MSKRLFVLVLFAFASVACGKPQLAALCDSNEDCDGELCEPIGANVQGQCTRRCQSDDQCAEAFGEGECVVACKLNCGSDDECPSGTACIQEICRAACVSDADCVSEARCSYGLCEVVE